ncbi:MAG: hypothetical protein COU09_02280 [Candidatus Harrisonbacteria bacterium CG10_big_fil_rev_8_21_14_0_10_44_23]|uniref:Uncharacterized protein n=1 Tax=Candidatus Harrisonbacteria bacterium CG10_big_fil_rev_8_21_14_0_10_44_23 TaxID=1974585 RepID=A0A2H0UPW9_9BACT|nr:MAG: hypothetical protein COU09_02280 [Candidatus Harrisonbacteria bacterium CG10_big_fil_rev_8_21_14_0_10_44_23]
MVLTLQIVLGVSGLTLVYLLWQTTRRGSQEVAPDVNYLRLTLESGIDWTIDFWKDFKKGMLFFFGEFLQLLVRGFDRIADFFQATSEKVKERSEVSETQEVDENEDLN